MCDKNLENNSDKAARGSVTCVGDGIPDGAVCARASHTK